MVWFGLDAKCMWAGLVWFLEFDLWVGLVWEVGFFCMDWGGLEAITKPNGG